MIMMTKTRKAWVVCSLTGASSINTRAYVCVFFWVVCSLTGTSSINTRAYVCVFFTCIRAYVHVHRQRIHKVGFCPTTTPLWIYVQGRYSCTHVYNVYIRRKLLYNVKLLHWIMLTSTGTGTPQFFMQEIVFWYWHQHRKNADLKDFCFACWRCVFQIWSQWAQRLHHQRFKLIVFTSMHIACVTPQYNTTQHNTTQTNTIQHNTANQHTTPHHNTIQHTTIQHKPIQYNTTQQINTPHHNTIQHSTMHLKQTKQCGVLLLCVGNIYIYIPSCFAFLYLLYDEYMYRLLCD